MKKIISILLAASMLLSATVSVSAQGRVYDRTEITLSAENTDLSEHKKSDEREKNRNLSVEERIEKRKAESEKERLERRNKEDGTEAELMASGGGGASTVIMQIPEGGTEINGVTYTFENGTLTISGDGTLSVFAAEVAVKVKKVVIEYGMTTIPDDAFEDFYNLEEVIIPDSVDEIESYAFSNCYSLRSIDIPASVTNIGSSAFFNCFALENINVAEGNIVYKSIDGVLFRMTETQQRLYYYPVGNRRTAYTIPEGTTYISSSAFKYAKVLESITIPDTVTVIGSSAFSDCTMLEEITIPDSVTDIGYDMFSGCYSLKEVTLPAKLTTLSYYAFDYCYSLESIQIAEGNENFRTEDGILFGTVSFDDENGEEVSHQAIIKYPSAKEGAEYTIPDDITCIYDYAFADTGYLDEVIIHDNVEHIECGAFMDSSIAVIDLPDSISYITGEMLSGCYNLEEVVIPESVTQIHEYAFMGCESLASVIIPESVKEIHYGAFSDCYSLEEIEILSDELEYLDGDIFAYCYSLESVALPDNLYNIGSGMFTDCISLAEVDIPETVTSIDPYAFLNCESLVSIDIPANTEELYYDAFSGCYSLEEINVAEGNAEYKSIDGVLIDVSEDAETLIRYPVGKSDLSYTVPSTVTEIDEYAFEYCEYLEELVIGSNVTEIDMRAFMNCTSLVSAVWPESVEVIPQQCFAYCESLEEVAIPDTVTKINFYAFEGCSSLEDVVIPSGVEHIDYTAFTDCIAGSFEVSEANEYYKSVDGVLYDKAMTELVAYPAASEMTSFTVPASVEYVSADFAGAYLLEEILVEDGNTYYKSIDGVLYDYDVTGIEKYPDGKTDTEYVIPDTVETIGNFDLDYNIYIKSVTIPASVTYIANVAFTYAIALEEINVDENNVNYKSQDGVLFTKYSGMLMQYPMSKTDEEYTAPVGTKGIYQGAFYSNDYIGEVTLLSGAAYLLHSSFAYNGKLAGVSVPRSMSSMFYSSLSSLDDTFVLRGYENSYAEAFAYENGFNFDVLEDNLISASASKTGSKVSVSMSEAVASEIYVVQYDKDGYILAIDTQTTSADSTEYIITVTEKENEAKTKVIILDGNNKVTPVAEVMDV